MKMRAFLSKVFERIIRFLSSYCQTLNWNIRCIIFNIQPRVFVSRKAFINKTARLQLKHGDRSFYADCIHISDNVYINDGVIIAPYNGDIHIGENVFLGPYCVLYGHGGLRIGKDTMIAAHCVLIPSNHGFSDREIPIRNQIPTSLGIDIGEDVWIGCGVRVLDGVSIGKGCVVGSGAVVNKSLPSYSIAVGIPARVIGRRGEKYENSVDLKLNLSVKD